jgi:stage V sporulation protein SpoVS
MKLKYRLTLTVALVFACVASGAAQDKGAKTKFKHSGKIQATYDRAQDRTVVAFQPYAVNVNHHDPTESVAIAAGFVHPGQTLATRPQFIEFGVISQTRDGWKFEQEKDRALTLVLDGEAIALGNMKLITARRFTLGALYYREDLAFTMPYEGFVRMANAKKVVVKVGKTELKLVTEHFEVMLDLISRAETS